MSAATNTRACPTCGWYFGVMPQTYIRTGRPETSKFSFCPLRVDVMRCVTAMYSYQQVRELYWLDSDGHRSRGEPETNRQARHLIHPAVRGRSSVRPVLATCPVEARLAASP